MLPSSVAKPMKSAVSQSECNNGVQQSVGVALYVQYADGGGSRLDTKPPHIHTVRSSDCQQEVWDIFHPRTAGERILQPLNRSRACLGR